VGIDACRRTQTFDFGIRQSAPAPFAQTLDLKRADRNANERKDLMFETSEHPADFTVLALGQNHFHHRHVASLRHDSGASGTHFALCQPDAVRKLRDDFVAGIACDSHSVSLFHPEAWVSQPLCERAVVRQQHQTFAVTVQATDDKDPFLRFRNQIEHERTTGRVFRGADVPLGFVDQVVNVILWMNALTIHGNARRFGVDFRAEFANDLAVDRHATFQNQQFAGSSGSDACLGKNLVKAFRADFG
jgi:hypothetical protein